METTGAVAFLALNDMGKLANLAIYSVLRNSDSQVYVGYLNEHDVRNFPQGNRINYLKLHSATTELSGSSYMDYSTNEFFDVVQLKWGLIRRVLSESGSSFVVYSDLDVMWRSDVCDEIASLYNRQPWIQIAVQDNSPNLHTPILCMGLFAIRNTEWARDFLGKCEVLHSSESKFRNRVGDDEIITSLYHENDNASRFFLLPQAVFPTGNLIQLTRSGNTYPSLHAHQISIFHANYSIGLRKKILLQYIALQRYSVRKLYFSTSEIIGIEIEIALRKFKSILSLFLRCIRSVFS